MSVQENKSFAYPFPIDPKMFAEQRERLGESISSHFIDSDHAALLRAGSEVPINSTDCNYLFVQESYFYYLFGIEIPDAYGVVLASGEGILFIPRLPAEYATWMGVLPTPESVQRLSEVDEVYYVDEMEHVLRSKNIRILEVLNGVNTDSGLKVLTATLPFSQTSSSCIQTADAGLFAVLSKQRSYKTRLEIDVLQYVCKVSSNAHIKVMQICKPGMSQHHLESTFLHDVYYNGGCRRASYTCICATGGDGATLHYPHNNNAIEDGSMALLDMGGNYRGYAADITCSFPVNGTFTAPQVAIYNAVLDAHDRVMRAMKPGVSWVDMHKLAIRTTCEHLVRIGVLRGDVDELMGKEVMQFFQPHGLGHLIGLDVHDVGAYFEGGPPRPTARDCCKLRTARVLEENMYMTIEPGCYFNHALLEMALKDPCVRPYINEGKLREYWNFGGVRIESDVLVTKDGVINFTCVPRTTEEIEQTMAGKEFSKEIEIYRNA